MLRDTPLFLLFLVLFVFFFLGGGRLQPAVFRDYHWLYTQKYSRKVQWLIWDARDETQVGQKQGKSFSLCYTPAPDIPFLCYWITPCISFYFPLLSLAMRTNATIREHREYIYVISLEQRLDSGLSCSM